MIYQPDGAKRHFRNVRAILDHLQAQWPETPVGCADKFRMSRNDHGYNIIKARVSRLDDNGCPVRYWVFVGYFDEILKAIQDDRNPWIKARQQ